MGEKRGTKGVSIRLGDELEDDDETTALDLSPADVREALEARLEKDEGAKPAPRPPPPSVADDDPDKTEMIERPELGPLEAASSPRGVVPLGADAAKLLGKPASKTPHTDVFSADMSDEAETVMMTRPLPRPDVRALDELSLPPIASDMSDDETASSPKIARMSFRPAEGEREAPPPRPLPPPPNARRRGPVDAAGPDASARADEAVLIVEAPPGAAVFVDGMERGTGRVEVPAANRFARVAVRVHRAGYKPWTRTLSFEGQQALHVVPELEPR